MCSIRTAESVCADHPDKLADQIADQILNDILYDDKAARVAVEVMAAGRRIIVAGEITTNHRPRIRESVRTALARGVRIILQAGIRQWPQICVAMNLGVLLDGRYIHGLIGTARHGVGSLRPRTPVTSSANEFTGLQPVKNIFPFKASISYPRLATLRNPLLATNSIPVHLRGMKSPALAKRPVHQETRSSQRQRRP